eukprot:TRINITY_DN12648_c0_g1_i1.p2 TRINITY_DN12648_c0_g1~~TRINITY_DN12648_c0_g1_i1.p2  ORF type:complete len:125 (+),score=13.82 TRINITY_DN12648_c0_g1_i1:139-513(+)
MKEDAKGESTITSKEGTYLAPNGGQGLHQYDGSDYAFDHSKLKPTLANFEALEKDADSKFPYKFMLFPGNNSTVVNKTLKFRGFTRVISKVKDRFPQVKRTLSPALTSYGSPHSLPPSYRFSHA